MWFLRRLGKGLSLNSNGRRPNAARPRWQSSSGAQWCKFCLSNAFRWRHQVNLCLRRKCLVLLYYQICALERRAFPPPRTSRSCRRFFPPHRVSHLPAQRVRDLNWPRDLIPLLTLAFGSTWRLAVIRLHCCDWLVDSGAPRVGVTLGRVSFSTAHRHVLLLYDTELTVIEDLILGCAISQQLTRLHFSSFQKHRAAC